MNWMDKLERKLGRYAVPNLSRYFVGAIVLGYVLSMLSPGFTDWVSYDVSAILHGQIWRLFTWIFMPTTSLDFFGLLFLLCVLMWGSSLESMLGTFRMNVFLWGGVILSDVGGILIYVITKLTLGTGASIYLSTYYILMSMLLALAICMPEGEVRLYFVLPIKMKWMAILYAVITGYELITGLTAGNFGRVAVILGSLVNFGIFYLSTRDFYHVSPRQVKRRATFRKQTAETNNPFAAAQGSRQGYRHKCCICGRTDVTNPELTFRYCSKCKGNREYCEDHLFTHTHVQ